MATLCISWLYAYKSEAYVFLNIFTMLASVATAVLGWAVYGDAIKPTRIMGFILLFAAVYVMSLYNKSISGKITKRGAITLLLGGVGTALADFMQKVYTKEALGEPCVFTFYTYFLMIVPQLFVLLLFKKSKNAVKNPILCDRRHILIFFIISAALYVNVITKTMAPRTDDTIETYPLPVQKADWGEYYKNVFAHLRGEADIIVTHDQQRRLMRLVEAIFESGKTNKVVEFNDII